MIMKPFGRVVSRVTPLHESNVDTDQIIPKQFLKRVSRTGFGKYLFYDRRKNTKRKFVLDDTRYNGSRILVSGENFGCGSSREHAVWALQDFGFDVVMAPSFADIFFSNCIKNGLLPVRLSNDVIERLMAWVGPVTVDLKEQRVQVGSEVMAFEIDPYKKIMLLEGVDEIAQTLQHKDQISAFEVDSAYPSVKLS